MLTRSQKWFYFLAYVDARLLCHWIIPSKYVVGASVLVRPIPKAAYQFIFGGRIA